MHEELRSPESPPKHGVPVLVLVKPVDRRRKKHWAILEYWPSDKHDAETGWYNAAIGDIDPIEGVIGWLPLPPTEAQP